MVRLQWLILSNFFNCRGWHQWSSHHWIYMEAVRYSAENSSMKDFVWSIGINIRFIVIVNLYFSVHSHVHTVMSTNQIEQWHMFLSMYSYTPRTLRACCSQSKFRILKIRESSAHALFCTIALRTSRAVLTRAWASHRVDLRQRRVDSFSKRVIIFCW